MIDTSNTSIVSVMEGLGFAPKRKSGNEYSSACPFCGGNDRFVLWEDESRYWCRQCNKSGDAIQLVMEVHSIPFLAAIERLNLQLPEHQTHSKRQSQPMPKGINAQRQSEALKDVSWRQAAEHFCGICNDNLYDMAGGREYLAKRGISMDTAGAWGIGFNPEDYHGKWGQLDIWLPRGIVFPYESKTLGDILAVNVRNLGSWGDKYIKAKGSSNTIFRGWTIYYDRVVVMVESEIDALSIEEATQGRWVVPVATGSTTNGRLIKWVARLAAAKRVLVAYDNDDAGNKASEWWLEHLPNASRLAPCENDINDMLCKSRSSVLAWLRTAFETV